MNKETSQACKDDSKKELYNDLIKSYSAKKENMLPDSINGVSYNNGSYNRYNDCYECEFDGIK